MCYSHILKYLSSLGGILNQIVKHAKSIQSYDPVLVLLLASDITGLEMFSVFLFHHSSWAAFL